MARKTSKWYEAALSRDPRTVARETGLPLPLVRRAAEGKAQLSSGSMGKLKNYYRRENYRELRESGATPKEARGMQGAAPATVNRYTTIRKAGGNHTEAHTYGLSPELPRSEIRAIARGLLDAAKKIWQENKKNDPGLTLENVLRGMRMSTRTSDEWETYVKLRSREQWTDRSDPRSTSVFGPTLLTLKQQQAAERAAREAAARAPLPEPDFTVDPWEEKEDEEDFWGEEN